MATTSMDLADIARMAHEVIRAFNSFHGDHSIPAWDDAPAWQRESTFRQIAFLADHPDAGDSGTHDDWLAFKRETGWTWGPVKDPALKQHPDMVPFDRLPRQSQVKDRLFRTVVRVGLGQ